MGAKIERASATRRGAATLRRYLLHNGLGPIESGGMVEPIEAKALKKSIIKGDGPVVFHLH